jgi:hypothetical protein
MACLCPGPRPTCITTLAGACAAVEACQALRQGELTMKPLQDGFQSA